MRRRLRIPAQEYSARRSPGGAPRSGIRRRAHLAQDRQQGARDLPPDPPSGAIARGIDTARVAPFALDGGWTQLQDGRGGDGRLGTRHFLPHAEHLREAASAFQIGSSVQGLAARIGALIPTPTGRLIQVLLLVSFLL